ncbi:MAG: acyl-CoA reductase [Bacteroidia bacterium]
MSIDQRIKAFVVLGKFLEQFTTSSKNETLEQLNEQFHTPFSELISLVERQNGWFTKDSILNSLNGIVINLREEALVEWLSDYIANLQTGKPAKNVAVIMAGNIPMVGFHDMLCVLLSGNKFTGKLSSDDKLLLPAIARVLKTIEPGFEGNIEFTEGQLKNIDAVIATGSNNSARYFEYYFGKYPHIIRKNRNSAAVLTGNETTRELELLGNDIFQYFGLGCRNVSKIFVPQGYKFETFYEAIFKFKDVINNNKYGNNYEYNRTVYLMNQPVGLLDNNFLLLKEDTGYSSPIGVLFYEYYTDATILNNRLIADKELLQCIVSGNKAIQSAIPFGTAQTPGLDDYADRVDTMQFLVDL